MIRPFTYLRPASIEETVRLLAEHGPDARLLAGGTDLLIRLRDGSLQPTVVIDTKRIGDLQPRLHVADGHLTVSATAVMTDLVGDAVVRRLFPALAEAAVVVGSVQIRNRATLAGNVCNASPAADTIPALLIYEAVAVVAGVDGERRLPVDDLFVRSGLTTLARGEFITAFELPLPTRRAGSVHLRRTRRRGHDLAAVTLACANDEDGVTRLAYGSLGPRPVLAVDRSGTLADPASPEASRSAVLGEMLAGAAPSPTSMRAGPTYRLAMLGVLAQRGLATAATRLAQAERP
jgi:CO/xanthine dehydrogenase FAD-binding subunit